MFALSSMIVAGWRLGRSGFLCPLGLKIEESCWVRSCYIWELIDRVWEQEVCQLYIGVVVSVLPVGGCLEG